MTTAWVLNLDADDELQDPAGYTPTAAVARRSRLLTPHLRGLVAAGDVILDSTAAPAANGTMGQAWCPTPRALARLAAAGALVPHAPALAVLQHVNHRGFCAALGQTLEAAAYVRSLNEVRAHLGRHPPRPWVLKRPHGFSGRGMRRMSPVDGDAGLWRWIEAALQQDGGLQVEPWVERERDFGLHGYVDATGAVHFGTPTVQECDARGAWVRSRALVPGEITAPEADRLRAAAERVATALAAAGYFGPFGIDAYRWRDAGGHLHFNPQSEINARYSMGWQVGMGEWRPEAVPDATSRLHLVCRHR